jgi:excisionase family DNA binding protein
MNDVLNESEAADLLDCEPSTVQEAARRGELPAVKFGRSWRFPRGALLVALDQKAMANMVNAVAKPKAIQMGVAKRMAPVLPVSLQQATK